MSTKSSGQKLSRERYDNLIWRLISGQKMYEANAVLPLTQNVKGVSMEEIESSALDFLASLEGPLELATFKDWVLGLPHIFLTEEMEVATLFNLLDFKGDGVLDEEEILKRPAEFWQFQLRSQAFSSLLSDYILE